MRLQASFQLFGLTAHSLKNQVGEQHVFGRLGFDLALKAQVPYWILKKATVFEKIPIFLLPIEKMLDIETLLRLNAYR